MPPVKSFGERIADALIEDGLLTVEQVGELLAQQKKEGTRLLKLVIDKALVSEQDMTVCMGRVLNVPPINLARLSILPEVADLLPREISQNHKVIAVARLDSKLFIAMADPLNVLALDDVKRITKFDVFPMIASEKAILDKLSGIDASGLFASPVLPCKSLGRDRPAFQGIHLWRQAISRCALLRCPCSL